MKNLFTLPKKTVITPFRHISYVNFKGFADKFKEKESAEEAYFVNKNEREALKKLLRKAKEQHRDHEVTEITELKAILNKHKITVLTDELIKDIQKWRDIHH